MTNREIAQVFMLYHNAIIVHPLYPNVHLGYDKTMADWFCASEHEKSLPSFWSNKRLVLAKLDNITHEHAEQLSRVAFPYEWDSLLWSVQTGKQISDTAVMGCGMEGKYANAFMTDAMFYLISNNYAVPLWFAYGHESNGSTAIELQNIAIDMASILK